MEHEREEESGEMYSPNESGEYTLCGDVPNFTVQGLWDALTKAESVVTEPPPPANEFIIQLEVTMADRPGRPQPPAYSWNGGLVSTCTEERSSFEGLRTRAGRRPRTHIFILL